jgi:hypothetical protein
VLAVELQVPEPTTTQAVVVSVTLPDVPVTVTTYPPVLGEDELVAVSVEVPGVVLLKVSEVGERTHVG